MQLFSAPTGFFPILRGGTCESFWLVVNVCHRLVFLLLAMCHDNFKGSLDGRTIIGHGFRERRPTLFKVASEFPSNLPRCK